MATPRGVLLIGPRSLDERAARYVREQVRTFVEHNKHKCSFILLPDLPGTPEACAEQPEWLEVNVLTPQHWAHVPPLRWEGKRVDRLLELPMRKAYWYAREGGLGADSFFASRSYRFGIDWVAPWGAVLAFMDPSHPCRDVDGALHYAKEQQVQVFTRSTS